MNLLKTFLACAAVSFVLTASASAKELFLCRNVRIQEPVGNRQVTEWKKKEGTHFRPGDRIVAVFCFKAKGTEEWIEFRWMRQLGRSSIEKEKYVHSISHANHRGDYVSYAWIILNPSWIDKMLGSVHAGDWYVEVFVDGRKEAEAYFNVGHD